jgi:hypothetical protein
MAGAALSRSDYFASPSLAGSSGSLSPPPPPFSHGLNGEWGDETPPNGDSAASFADACAAKGPDGNGAAIGGQGAAFFFFVFYFLTFVSSNRVTGLVEFLPIG